MQLIEAVVDDAIRRGTAGQVSQEDRDRIVTEAHEQFQRVSRIQAESEALITQQKQVLTRQHAQIQQLERTQAQLRAQIGQQNTEGQQGQTVRLQAEALEKTQQDLREAVEREQKSARALKRLNRRLASTRQTIVDYDKQMDAFAEQARQDKALIEQLRSHLLARDQELNRVQGLMNELNDEVATLRRRDAADTDTVGQLRDELADLKGLLSGLDRGDGQADRAAIEAMLERLTQREAATQSQLEERFKTRLDRVFDQVTHAVRSVTARAVDRPVDATDVYLSKIFDDDSTMESNLDHLDVCATTASEGISESLARLKQLRHQASQAIQEDPGEEQTQENPGDR